MQHDLAYMAGQWRDVVVKEVGRERYDKLSQELGCDLAYAFVDYRVEQLMIDQLVKERMPKSSADYIIRGQNRACWDWTAGFGALAALAEEIETRERLPTGRASWRKVRAGCWGLRPIRSCWAVQVRGRPLHGSSVRIRQSQPLPTISGRRKRSRSLQECINKGVFGSDSNVFDSFRKGRQAYRAKKTQLLQPTESSKDTDCNIRFYGLVENRQ